MRYGNCRIAALVAVLPLVFSYPARSQTVASTGNDVARLAMSGKKLLGDIDRHGISFRGTMIFDWSKSIDAEDPSFGFGRHSFDVSAAIDGKKLWRLGGSAALLRLRNHLNSFGEDRVGAAQLYSNIDAGERTALYEAWIDQRLFSDKLRLKGGKIDANTEFDAVQTAGDFLNASMGYSPTIVAFPSYPEPKLAFTAFLQPTVHNGLATGIFETASSGTLSILEPSRTWTVGHTRIKAGSASATGTCQGTSTGSMAERPTAHRAFIPWPSRLFGAHRSPIGRTHSFGILSNRIRKRQIESI